MEIEEVWKKIFPCYAHCRAYKMLTQKGLRLGSHGKVCRGYWGKPQFKRFMCNECPMWDGTDPTNAYVIDEGYDL